MAPEPATADEGAPGGPPPELGPDTPVASKPKYPRLDSTLNRLAAQAGSVSASSVASQVPLSQGDAVAVTVRVLGGPDAVEAYLEDRGVQVANAGHGYVEAYVPVDLLPALSERPEVLRVSVIVPPQPSVISQGTLVHGSPPWVARGFTGAGVKVGIIDAGFEGYGALIGSELTAPVQVRCYTAVGLFTSNLAACENGILHGTAVAEAVVDMAPDVGIYIANPRSPGDLRNIALWMVGQGVTVINMSLAWRWDGPGDGTSPFSDSALDTVTVATSLGAVWVNAAGNAAQSSWYGPYSDANGNGFIEFEAGNELNGVVLSAGDRITVQARWEDSWTGAARDFDLYLYDSGLNLVAGSEDEQSGTAGQIPREWFQFTPTVSGTYFLSIKHFSGSVPLWLQMNSFSQDPLEVAVADHSVENPAESADPGLLAVGASDWATPTVIESFSSRGPTTDGRTKPDIVGADRGDSVSYGPRGFPGTSQASPHVAGMAALVLQHSPELTPAGVADFLKANALPRGPVPNNDWGFGFAQLPALTLGAPAGVVAVPGTDEASVSWSAPPDGGSPITGYTVESSREGRTAVVGGQTLNATVTGLTNGTAYTFAVTAENAVGQSDPSTASQAVTPQGPPGPPTGVVAVPGNATAIVFWEAPDSDGGSPLTQYQVASDPAGHSAAVDGSTLQAAFGGLANGVGYGFVVTAFNAFGTGPPSATSPPVVPKGPPGPPLAVAATPGDGQAVITWSPPTSDGGSTVTHYAVLLNPGSHSVEVGGSTLSATVTGLENGTPYTVLVTATNSEGTSAPSEPSDTATPIGLPGPPLGVAAIAGVGEALVKWTAPRSDGGAPIEGYLVTAHPGGQTAAVDAATFQASVDGLANGADHTFTVAASNAVGTGPGSEPSAAVAPAAPTPIPAHSTWALAILAAFSALVLALRPARLHAGSASRPRSKGT